MNFDWSHYLTLANKLAVDANNLPEPEKEAALRTALSRAIMPLSRKPKNFFSLKMRLTRFNVFPKGEGARNRQKIILVAIYG
jgi:hypothetical protein